MRLCAKSIQLPLYKYLYVISPILIVSGIASIIFRFDLLQFITDCEMLLTPNSRVVDSWTDFPYNSKNFYFFNWTNPEDIYNDKIKPKFEEVGPYKFHEHRKKGDVTWNDNGTVTYKQKRFWYYKDEESNGNLQDNITTLNPVALSAVFIHRDWNYFVRKGFSWLLSSKISSIAMTRTVDQMLFEGYLDSMINVGLVVPFTYRPPFDKFGWFYSRNGSEDYEGVYNVGTGINSTLGELYHWNYQNETPFYPDDCAKFGGSAGEVFERYSGKDTVRLFAPDLCKMFLLKYVEQREVRNIMGNKFTAEDLMFDNGTIYPENKCSCNGECLPSGVINITNCKFGAPTFVSLPHFYNADPYYLSLVEGLVPDKRKHELYVVVEPTTGVPLETRVRVQINMLLQPFDYVPMYEKVPKLVFPLLWFEENMRLPHKDAFFLKLLVFTPTTSIVIGSIAIICGLISLVYIFYKRSMSTVNVEYRTYFYLDENGHLKY